MIALPDNSTLSKEEIRNIVENLYVDDKLSTDTYELLVGSISNFDSCNKEELYVMILKGL
jgi:hypothetical protein